MEKYYNHLTDRLEDLEPFMAKTLPRSKEEYLARLKEREQTHQLPKGLAEYPLTPCEAYPTEGDEITEEKSKSSKQFFIGENPLVVAAREYLDEHPNEVIKLRDEGLVQELITFADKDNTGAIQDAPTEEEVYLEKREREGRPLVIWEEAGKMPDFKETWDKAKGSDYDIDKSNSIDWSKEKTFGIKPLEELNKPIKTPFEPSRYMMGNDPYGDAVDASKAYLYRKNEDGSVEYLRTPEQIINEVEDEDDDSAAEKISKWIIFGIITVAIFVILWFALH